MHSECLKRPISWKTCVGGRQSRSNLRRRTLGKKTSPWLPSWASVQFASSTPGPRRSETENASWDIYIYIRYHVSHTSSDYTTLQYPLHRDHLPHIGAITRRLQRQAGWRWCGVPWFVQSTRQRRCDRYRARRRTATRALQPAPESNSSPQRVDFYRIAVSTQSVTNSHLLSTGKTVLRTQYTRHDSYRIWIYNAML